MTGITVLASYPKSGNTWVRAFATSLLQNGAPIDINGLIGHGGADRLYFDDALEVETSDLLPEEIARLRAEACRIRFGDRRDPVLLKMHDAWLPAPGSRAFPLAADMIGAVVFLVRDPRDVAVSMAHHGGSSIDEAIARLSDTRRVIARTETSLDMQIAQYLSSWSAHTSSWLNSGLPVSLIRYEDLLADSLAGFTEIVRAIGSSGDPALIGQAIAATRFEALQEAERRSGFSEATRGVPDLFFRHGKAGAWRDRLSADQAAQIVRDHAAVMRKLGYLP